MLNLKKNVLLLISVMLLIVALLNPASVYATDQSMQVITPNASPTVETTPTASVTASPKATQTPKATATPATTSTKLPQTGVGDYTGIIVAIIILGISIVFSYKKIKDYNKF